MKFYDFAMAEQGNDLLEKYTIEKDKTNSVLKLCFDESDTDTYLRDMRYISNMRRGNAVNFIGEDGYIYSFYFDGKREKIRKLTKKDRRRIWNSRINLSKKINRDSAYMDKILLKYPDGQLNFISIGFMHYDKYLYINNDRNYTIPFRFKKAKNPNAPLLVYYQGAGALGHDNFKPFFEFRNVLFGKKLPDCNILIPQAPYGTNYGVKMTAFYKYIDNCILLINALISSFDMTAIVCIALAHPLEVPAYGKIFMLILIYSPVQCLLWVC